ncbi:unnamed protein product [Rotaria magnacalcarata]|uniref:Uncharacterized protein n=1 Tax=Rotaria magnacalcarata TaxID=392030 RepID=A0A8S2PIM6_9BILA|nr:unnamed protein product [Rotaria magnacalcarata]
MSKATNSLIRLVEGKAGEQYSVGKAHQLLQQGADIKALTKTGSMIDSVIAAEMRHRSIGSPKADNCLHLIQVLKKSACDQLNEQVFSIGGGDLNEMQQLVQLKASCYQAETFGPLGLLGSLVNQDKIPIRIEVVQFLVEYEPNEECVLAIVDTQQQTCLSLAKKNPKCPKDVIDYLQRQFNMIFNQIPFTKPLINPNEVIGWISRGANMEATDKNRNTILSNAVMANNLELIRVLVSAGNQQTPLHLATKNHHLLVVRYLVKWGADYQAQNLSKQTPLNIARANMSNSKEEEMSDRKLIQFLEQLICPPADSSVKQKASSRKPNYDLDTCELVAPVDINPIQVITEDAEGALGKISKGILAGKPNNNLHEAARHGAIFAAQQAIAQGADIRHRKGGHIPYEVAQMSAKEYAIKLNAPTLNLEKRSHVQNMLAGCQQIADIIRQVAQEKLVAAISQSDAGLVVAYHLSGAPLTTDLLYRACNASDNVEIVDYLLNQSMDIYQAMINNAWPDSLYRTAKKNKFNKVANYLKYRLSMECTKAIKENNLELVNKLVRNGASVDTHNTNNIQVALEHQNAKMIQLLCQNGAKMPSEWLSAQHIVLPPAVSQQLKPEISFHINRCLIDRRLRFAAASGDLDGLIQCQRLNVDMNSANCRGSTALLCTIQYGNYFPIVHALVSRGASMLHSNEDEPMSLIDLATKKNYKQIADYLTKELNLQFLSAILNNDRKSAEKFAQLGADFNYQDEQRRTALHYAVQYHGIDLVTWLCECGSVPTMSDINNDYPIILATEKGNRVSNGGVALSLLIFILKNKDK